MDKVVIFGNSGSGKSTLASSVVKRNRSKLIKAIGLLYITFVPTQSTHSFSVSIVKISTLSLKLTCSAPQFFQLK